MKLTDVLNNYSLLFKEDRIAGNKDIPKMRYGGVDLLKHLLALFVVFQHMCSETRYTPEVNIFILEVVDYIDGAVMGFFLISGFFFSPSATFKEWIKKMFKRTMIPFLIFSVIYAVFLILLGKANVIDSLWKIITLKGVGMQLYYLPYLFLIAIVYFLIHSFSTKAKISLPYLLLGVMLVALTVALFTPTISSTGNDLRLFPLYILSYGAGIWFSKSLKVNLNTFCISVLLMLLLSIGLGFYDHRFYDLAFMIALFMGFTLISIYLKVLHRTFHGSGGVYLLHTPIVNFSISTFFVFIGIQSYTNLFLSWLLTYISCLIFTLLFIHYFPSKKWILLE